MENPDKTPPKPLLMGPGMRLWLLIALYIACLLVLVMLSKLESFTWLSAGEEGGFPVNYGRFGLALYGIICFAIPALVYANIFPYERFQWFKLQIRVEPVAALYGIAAILVSLLGLEFLLEWLMNNVYDQELRDAQKALEEDYKWLLAMPAFSDLVILLFTSAFIPAICEELFFRAGIQQLLMEWLKKPHLCISITAVTFALFHYNPAELPVYFLAGLMLGYAFCWTGSLRINFLMHFMFNASILFRLYIIEHNPALKNWEPGPFISLAGFALAALFMYLLYRNSRKPLKGISSGNIY
ncbi:MAG TPA: CPBP family intramembrane glutamic endopeptidase [Bacteroidia bacterium]|nr:CPBP family intramembrane glutamic endopeptidase [Bacteroidia bacterium]